MRRLHAKCVCLVYACVIFSLLSPFAIGTDSNSASEVLENVLLIMRVLGAMRKNFTAARANRLTKLMSFSTGPPTIRKQNRISRDLQSLKAAWNKAGSRKRFNFFET